MGEGKSGSASNKGWRVVFVVALIVFIASVAALIAIGVSYMQGQQKYGDVAEEAGLAPDDLAAEPDVMSLTVDWDALLAVNPDTVGWVYAPGTSVSYPVVQGADNEHYLTYDFDGDQGWLANYGSVFLDYRNARDWSDPCSFVYGHHMNDGSMFSDFAGFWDQGRFDACRTIYLLTPGGNMRLRTFSFVHASAEEEIVQTKFTSAEEMTAYVQDKLNRSSVNPGDVPPADQLTRIVAFATCDNVTESGRYILYAYVEQENADGLVGSLGIQNPTGDATGFEDGLVQTDQG